VQKEKWIITSPWPIKQKKFDDQESSLEMERAVKIITAVRNVRAFWNIAHTAEIEISLEPKVKKSGKLSEDAAAYVSKLCKCRIIENMSEQDQAKIRKIEVLAEGIKILVGLSEDIVDLEKEKTRVSKKLEDIEKYLTGINNKLKNKKFTENAPADIVDKEKGKQAKWKEERDFLKGNLAALK